MIDGEIVYYVKKIVYYREMHHGCGTFRATGGIFLWNVYYDPDHLGPPRPVGTFGGNGGPRPLLLRNQ